jgi:DNA-binding PadR family transcriptional regulator
VPKDASRNSLVLPLLGLMVEQPGHAYELTARLRSRYRHDVTRSTVTSLLRSMERDGVVAPGDPVRVGNRPARRAYALTDAGFDDFRRRVERALTDSPTASPDFVMGVAYASVLSAAYAKELLERRASRLTGEIDELGALPTGVHMLEVDYWSAVVSAERAWILRLAGRIREGDIEWP